MWAGREVCWECGGAAGCRCEATVEGEMFLGEVFEGWTAWDGGCCEAGCGAAGADDAGGGCGEKLRERRAIELGEWFKCVSEVRGWKDEVLAKEE